MFCPSCRSEFRADIQWCATCEVDLVGDLPKEDPFRNSESMAKFLEGSELVPLLSGEQTALQEVQLLLAAKQVATIFGQDDGSTGLTGRFALLTREEDAGRARTFLGERWKESVDVEGLGQSEGLDADQCPACGASLAETTEECADCGLFVGSAV